MKTRAVRLYGVDDIRLETFELPEPGDDEILVRLVSDSICHSTWKALQQGPDHKRVPDSIHEHPTIIGHELCGDIVTVGARWRNDFQAGSRFTVQPAIGTPEILDGFAAAGYSFETFGGDATYGIIPASLIEADCLLPLGSGAYYKGSLVEPLACVAAAFRAAHRQVDESHTYRSGIREGGTFALLGGCGPMGLAAIEYALHGDYQPSRILVTDRHESKIEHAQRVYAEEAKRLGIDLRFVNVRSAPEEAERVFGVNAFDDVIVMVPSPQAFEQGLRLLAPGGCLNAFAGPTDRRARGDINLYDLHYAEYNVFGSSASTMADLRYVADLLEHGRLDPAGMITHVGGLDSAVEATRKQREIGGGKKLIYTHLNMELTALRDMPAKADRGGVFRELSEILERSGFVWNEEAEAAILRYATG